MVKKKEAETATTEQRDTSQSGDEAAQQGIVYLLKGRYTDVRKMSRKQLQEETQMWRNVWGWVPSEVKYYVSRTGTLVAATQRNYQRHLGTLLDTHWTIDEIEIGVYEKVYDPNTGEHYFERKIIKIKPSGLNDIQWIAERTKETEIMRQAEQQIENEPQLPPEAREEEQRSDDG